MKRFLSEEGKGRIRSNPTICSGICTLIELKIPQDANFDYYVSDSDYKSYHRAYQNRAILKNSKSEILSRSSCENLAYGCHEILVR